MDKKTVALLPSVAPVHLAGAQATAAAFRVRREVVMEWIRRGRPVARDPRTGRYDGEYNKIQAWREAAFPAGDRGNEKI